MSPSAVRRKGWEADRDDTCREVLKPVGSDRTSRPSSPNSGPTMVDGKASATGGESTGGGVFVGPRNLQK